MRSHPIADGEVWIPNAGRLAKIFSILAASVFFLAASTAALLRAKHAAPGVDEIFILLILRHFSPAHILDALKYGLDTPPPFYFWMLQGFCKVLGVSAFAIRVPSLLGYFIFGAATFFLVRRRVSLPVALFVSALSWTSGATYAMTLGRPYALVMGFYALCALLWLDFPESGKQGLRALLTAVLVAGMLSVHFLSCVEVMALGIAELVRSWQDGKVQWKYWAGLVGGSLWLLASWPVIAPIYRLTHASIHAAGFYAKPTLFALIAQTRNLTIEGETVFGVSFIALTIVPLFMAISERRSGVERVPRPSDRAGFRDLDILSFASLTIPILTYLMARFLTGSLNQRYFLSAWLGVVLLLAHALHCMRNGAWVANLLLLVSIAHIGRDLFRRGGWPGPSLDSFQASITKPIPVAVPDGSDFFMLHENTNGDLHSRIQYVGHPPGAANPDPEPELIAENFKRAIPELPVYTGEAFLKDNKDFYVYYTNSPREGFTDWLITHSAVQVVAKSEDAWLLEARLPER